MFWHRISEHSVYTIHSRPHPFVFYSLLFLSIPLTLCPLLYTYKWQFQFNFILNVIGTNFNFSFVLFYCKMNSGKWHFVITYSLTVMRTLNLKIFSIKIISFLKSKVVNSAKQKIGFISFFNSIFPGFKWF